ncbi:MAG: hypothetical protein K2N74_05030 [Clostridiales bacterium]|nr:hypothetical protein [Clostridiales bacterium]
MNKKCALTYAAFALTLLLALAAMYFMSIFSVSKWVGVSVGGGVLIVSLVLLIVYRKKKAAYFAVVPVNGLASGIALSSLYVYLGGYPLLWQTVAVFGALNVLFVLYCLLTNFLFVQGHYVITLVVFSALLIGGGIVGVVLSSQIAFSLVLLALIPTIAFLMVLPASAKNPFEQIKNITYASFSALIVVIIVVLIVISEGDGLDGFGDGVGDPSAKAIKEKYNPFDYIPS